MKMKNKQMYVITMETGSYDSYSVSVMAVTDDFAKGEAYVNKMNQNFSSMDQKVKAFYQNEYVQWQRTNPRPDTMVKGLIEIPKWKGNQKITKEMREQRKALELKNSEIVRKAHEPLLQWSKDFNQYCENWAKTHLTQKEFEVYLIRDENHWSIEESKWL